MLSAFAGVAAATIASWNACTLAWNVASVRSALVVPVGYCAHHDVPLNTRVSVAFAAGSAAGGSTLCCTTGTVPALPNAASVSVRLPGDAAGAVPPPPPLLVPAFWPLRRSYAMSLPPSRRVLA